MQNVWEALLANPRADKGGICGNLCRPLGLWASAARRIDSDARSAPARDLEARGAGFDAPAPDLPIAAMPGARPLVPSSPRPRALVFDIAQLDCE